MKEQQGQMNMYDFLSAQESDHRLFVDPKPSTDVNKAVDKKNVITPRIIESRVRVYIVRR